MWIFLVKIGVLEWLGLHMNGAGCVHGKFQQIGGEILGN